MDRNSTGLKVARRHLLRLVGGLAVLTLYRPALAQQPMKQSTEGKATMNIQRNGSRPSTKGAQDYFSGSVRVEPVFQVGDPMRLNAGSVTFEPGARTAWHTHPLGQTLYVVSGVGRVQAKGGPIREIRPGDVVWIPPGEKHWHGASPTNGMTHVAMQEALDGSYVTWMEHVTDAEYSVKVG